MLFARTFPLCLAVIAALELCDSQAMAVDKIVDTILFPTDDSANGIFRWSEGTILNLDGKQNLIMMVSAFGPGIGYDHTPSRILEFRSSDGGRTWSPLSEAREHREKIDSGKTMSPSLLRLDNGEILFVFQVINGLEDGGPWTRRSSDDGRTWSEAVRLPYTGYGGPANDRVMQLTSGRVLLPCWISYDKLGSTYAYCFYSDDRGHTWEKTELIATPKGSVGLKTDPAAEEPDVIELDDGRLVMFIRTYLRTIYRCYSDDRGATWSKPEPTGIPAPGSMCTLERLPNGDILLVWNWCRLEEVDGLWPRNFLTAAISQDHGQTFSHVRHLDGSPEYPGKIVMANFTVVGDNVVLTYSKSDTRDNRYSWRLQVLPIAWFYEGHTKQVFGTNNGETKPISKN